MDVRLKKLKQWLATLPGLNVESIMPASDDASFRRYFRVVCGDENFIVMDAPPDKEDCSQFIAIARAMKAVGINVPDILQQNVHDGFLLLTDLGDEQYLGVLDKANVQNLYRDAMQSLLFLQKAVIPPNLLPNYDRQLLLDEMALFKDWFVKQYLSLELGDEQLQLVADGFELLADRALQQPRVWVHRDYHSRNLMHVQVANPGILDFQDAVSGPLTYDLVSLLRDCYISWPDEQVYAWVDWYFVQLKNQGLLNVDVDEFRSWFDWMGLQRHLKAIGIFARLKIRDNKPGYVQNIPRTLAYVLQVSCRYDELQSLCRWIESDIVPRMNALGLVIKD